MNARTHLKVFLTILFVLIGPVAVRAGADSAPTVRFSRDILPILSANCFDCHGPDEKARKAKLRLDTQAGAAKVIAVGKSEASELVRRITATDDDERMPPTRTGRSLSSTQKELIRRWIDQGAAWSKHWAYEAPARPSLPKVRDARWPRNAIDHFVLARLEQEGLSPASEARKETLLRRVTLDLTGVPPTLREIDAFLADRSPDAYEKVVDRLLASERYGERMAMDWLDDARYADTNGYQNDFARTMWPWRDWVIAAFNRNLSFDRFVIEQIAGDLLPQPTLEQRIATGFNRNNRTVTEAGSIDEEWRVENGVDRVETTSTVFLGLTLGCARCHDHKYDPITQKEFYQFYAFFNSINEKGVYTEQRGNVAPLISLPGQTDQEHLARLDAAIRSAEKTAREQDARLAQRRQSWEKEELSRPSKNESQDWVLRLPLDGKLDANAPGKSVSVTLAAGGQPAWQDGLNGKALRLDGKEKTFLELGQAVSLERTDRFSYGGWVRPRGSGALLSKMDDNRAYRGFDLLLQNGKIEVHLVHDWPSNAIKVVSRESIPQDRWSHVVVTYDGSSKAAGLRIFINGHPVALDIHNDHLTDTIATKELFRIGKRSTAFPLSGEVADVRVYRRTLSEADVQSWLRPTLEAILRIPDPKRRDMHRKWLRDVFDGQHARELAESRQKITKLRQERTDYAQRVPSVMIMEDLRQPRETYLLKRGRYDMPDKSQKLDPAVPAILMTSADSLAVGSKNRLGLARWLVDPSNPLTARVAINRYWQRYFGTGLVKSAENFGVQGEPPSHPELLDWLATEFIRTGWDVKAMQRLIVTSATYRQDSRETPALLQRDPENRLLARGPRFRLPAEVVRDNALAISGLLVERVGGPSVKPYQPAGLWEELAGGAGEGPYIQDKPPGLYRRSLYVYRKRTVPHPEMATFDAPSREVCQVKRSRTNTPLQALELLNDVTYVEAARHLAQLMLTEGGKSPETRLSFAFCRATARMPDQAELRVLMRGLQRYRERFRSESEAAGHFLHQGESPIPATLDPVELAAYTAAASVILNMDETITKE